MRWWRASALLAFAPDRVRPAGGGGVPESESTNSALPQTQITFRGIPASQIGHITVVGSTWGAHRRDDRGRLRRAGRELHPEPAVPAGETVTVTTGLNVIGGTNGAFHFGVAVPFGTINPMKLPTVPAGSNGVQHFHSRPDLEPASITVNRRSSSTYGGDIFLTPQYGPLQNGPMVLDPRAT